MPWVKIDKDYRFRGASGEASLPDLFDGKEQLIIYHFMLGPDWDEGCPSCSLMADNYARIDIHLAHMDIAFVTVSNAPLATIDAYKKRMGWDFKWVSSLGTDFNRDFHVSFSQEEVESGSVHYNYADDAFPSTEAPGLSVFAKGDDGAVYHTYSTYARGLDMMLGVFHYIDLTPKGRFGEKDNGIMYWVKRRDQHKD
jgi:predicted dithiol-disulfide oxidoreductase (DUF899 family)